MKLAMLIVDGDKKEDLEVVLKEAGVSGFTEIPNAAGTGATGPRLGSGAFPKTSAVVFTLLEEPQLAALTRKIREYCADCGERLRLVVWGVEQVI